MKLELTCPHCAGDIPIALPDHLIEILADERLAALGDGQTFEDLLYTSVTEEGRVACPKCGKAVRLAEENLNRLAMELLVYC